MKGATLCSGILAPEVAMPWVDWKWCAEIDPFCCELIEQRRPGLKNLGDLTAPDFDARAKAEGSLDLLVAGTPCQAFSVAGMRGSLSDSRGNLTMRFVEIVHAIDPRFVLWENVPGVLSTSDNAFGCLLAGLVGADAPLLPPRKHPRWKLNKEGDKHFSWPDAGVVAGPRRVLAWRVLDAQYNGLAQRRERVFVFSGRIGEWPHPGAVLFEPERMRRHFAPGREEEKEVAGTLGGGSSQRGWCDDTDRSTFLAEEKPDALRRPGRYDGETETFIPMVTPTLRSGGNQTGGDRPPGTDVDTVESLIAVPLKANSGRNQIEQQYIPILEAGARTGKSTDDERAGIGIGKSGDPMFTLQSGKQHAVAFDTTQITSKVNGNNPQPGDPCHPLAAGAHPPAIAMNGRQTPIHSDVAMPLDQKPGTNAVTRPGMMVRRLTPLECERLQGFPDGYTLIERGKKKKKPAADGPRYKALGNSMAVNVIRWLGERIRLCVEASGEKISFD